MCSSVVLIMAMVGTLSAAFMTRLRLVLRAVRRRSVTFGGLTLLAAVDFLQLTPPHFWNVMLNADVIPASINKPNSRNQVLTRFESQTPGRYAKVTANESGSPTSY